MPPKLVSGLSELAAAHDALICDVWGVIHDGRAAHPAAAAALRHFRDRHGPVVLLTNAPRTPGEVAAQCASYGVPRDCYDAIVSSGGAARDAVAALAAGRELPLHYIGPERDLPIIAGLPVRRAPIAEAEAVLCVGLRDDMIETPNDYKDVLAAMRTRDLTMLCANPDLVVHRGEKLVYCAGALAAAYEALGGRAVYYGKPHRPVYEAALAAAVRILGKAPENPLAVGDGLLTDVRGANAMGLDVLFIADGIHGEEVEPYNTDHLAALFARHGVTAPAAARTLTW